MLFAFEGLDCAVKTSALRELKRIIDKYNFVFCEEFSSPIGEALRTLLNEKGSFFLKTFYFAADRAWIYEKIAKPVLDKKGIVLWDRYVDSALAYRSAEVDKADIIDFSFVRKINDPFPKADLKFYFKISAQESVNRAKNANRNEPYDFSFLEKVSEYYDNLYKEDSSCIIIDGTLSSKEICECIINKICEFYER